MQFANTGNANIANSEFLLHETQYSIPREIRERKSSSKVAGKAEFRRVKFMASSTPLKGTDLIDCAKANAKQGIETAAHLCGYGNDLNTFERELHQACQSIGVNIDELSDLITDQQQIIQLAGTEVAPDSPSSL